MDRLTLAITSRLPGATTQSLGDDTEDRCPGCTLRCPFFLPLRQSRAVNEERWAGERVAETRVPCGYEAAGPESPCAGQTAGREHGQEGLQGWGEAWTPAQAAPAAR